MFFRLSSASEAITFYLIIFSILPSIFKKRNKSEFYPRLALNYLFILLIICVRFYDFLETNIFRSMGKQRRIRFLLYCLAPIEAIFDFSLVSLGVETLLELSNMYFDRRKLWVVYLVLSVGVPVIFLLLIVTIWEGEQLYEGVMAIAITESVLPAIIISLLIVAIYITARRKKMALSDDALVRIKVMILIHSCAITGMMLNLILFAIHAEVVMDDLIDSIVKLGVCASYLLVQPCHFLEPHILTSLMVDTDQTIPVNNNNDNVLVH